MPISHNQNNWWVSWRRKLEHTQTHNPITYNAWDTVQQGVAKPCLNRISQPFWSPPEIKSNAIGRIREVAG